MVRGEKQMVYCIASHVVSCQKPGEPQEGQRTPRVLLVEAHPHLARALRQGLEEEGFAVTVASDCGGAARQAAATAFDAIILNWMHFGPTGSSLLRLWRRAGWNVPVLGLIAPGEGANGDGLLDACLTLPFELDELLARLKEMVG
jgi:DNA-binding response OmpR family regulator